MSTTTAIVLDLEDINAEVIKATEMFADIDMLCHLVDGEVEVEDLARRVDALALMSLAHVRDHGADHPASLRLDEMVGRARARVQPLIDGVAA